MTIAKGRARKTLVDKIMRYRKRHVLADALVGGWTFAASAHPAVGD